MHIRFINKSGLYYRNIVDSLAYSVYYGLINSIKIFSVLKKGDLSNIKSILDFGCGTGALLPALEFLNFQGTVYGFDRSDYNLNIFRKFASSVHFQVEILRSFLSFKYDMILMANVLNELSNLNILKKVISTLSNPGTLLIIEPGDFNSTHNLLKIKKFIVNQGLDCIFPCVSNDNCPLIGSNNWCHTYVDIERGELLLILDKLTGLNHHRAKFSILIFKNTEITLPDGRVINVRKRGSRRMVDVCFGSHTKVLTINQKTISFEPYGPSPSGTIF